MGVFFIAWQLWEEMTFVLACAIVAVFLVGLFKLWRTSRQVRRQEVIDEEKRAHLTEMRKVSTLTASPRNKTRRHRRSSNNNNGDIPFGVRAIQTGVEVDGIWISRPTTPSQGSYRSKKLPSEVGTTSTILDKNLAEGKRLLGDYQPYASSPLGRNEEVAEPSVPVLVRDAQDQDHNGHAVVDTHSNTSTPLPQISEYAAFASSGGRGTLNEDALKRLEGTYSPTGFGPVRGGGIGRNSNSNSNTALRPPFLNTYIPSSRMSSPSPSLNANQPRPHYDSMPAPGSRAGASNGGSGSLGAQPSSNSNSSSNSNNNRDSDHSSASSRKPQQSRPAVSTASPAYASYRGYQTQPRHHSGPTSVPKSAPKPASKPASKPTPAQPSMSSPPQMAAFGTAIAGRTSRRVNSSFEVLPAGTFAAGSSGSADDEAETEAPLRATAPAKSAPPTRNKLRRSNGPLR